VDSAELRFARRIIVLTYGRNNRGHTAAGRFAARGKASVSRRRGQSPVLDADAWYAGTHREEGELLWVARYRPTGGGQPDRHMKLPSIKG
jgi:hypothetical protein